jgi:hypothetical protein
MIKVNAWQNCKLRFCFAGSRPAMSGLALVLSRNAVFLFRSPLRDTGFAYRNRPTRFVANAILPKVIAQRMSATDRQRRNPHSD